MALATLPGMRTNGFGEQHQQNSPMIGAACPLQQAIVVALIPDSYYENFKVEYQKRRHFVFHTSHDRKRWYRSRAGIELFSNSNAGATLIRFCFSKKYETLKKAGIRLRQI
jgi:hypothetical protein